MPPATNRELTNPETMRDAFKSMMAGAQFVFNGRSRPLEAQKFEGDKIGAESNRGTMHWFYFGDQYDVPRHKPNPNQTNKVKSLTVKAYNANVKDQLDATDKLTAKQEREVAWRRVFLGQSQADTADAMNVSPPTVKRVMEQYGERNTGDLEKKIIDEFDGVVEA